ncbi:hypothetical protein DCC39_16355 [Pueribacillus theae]|uniref:Uncharacterized protein n=1 Tax=Pueribacillus theae TaxID=2171751 RepID=A0A2U1JR88_9BACI|nr:hypothetical protein [Pueribacillus theae]PWA07707.1 hypothetical protein DCC39_16355 [Pueribacillus theae]
MIIGMVMSQDKETIVPIIEGSIARIYNTVTEESEDFTNPAMGLKEGRRGAAITWMLKQGVETLCAPPSTLCELSYEKAQEEQLHFYRLEPGTTFAEFQAQLQKGKLNLQESLPDEEIEPSNPPAK